MPHKTLFRMIPKAILILMLQQVLCTLTSPFSLPVAHSFSSPSRSRPTSNRAPSTSLNDVASILPQGESTPKRRVAIVGAGWGGLSAAHALSKEENIEVILIEASSRVGGLVRDGFKSTSGKYKAEAGQHGFWQNYHNIFRLLREEIPGFDMDQALSPFSEQGQYSPRGLEAVWPVFREQPLRLPTGLGQALYTRFENLSLLDRMTALPLVLAFSEFDDSFESWDRYDSISFRDLCVKLGVSKKCYDEAFEPMILTGLFAPGAECSAAAALGMAYFFVLQSQTAFDVQWCRGNIGEVIFDPWVKAMEGAGVNFRTSTRVDGFSIDETSDRISQITCKSESGETIDLEVDEVILAVGANALSTLVKFSPQLAKYKDLRRFANLRGTSVLATRLFLDKNLTVPYSANACWGFDRGIGMTMFDIRALHGNDAPSVKNAEGAIIEVDYYHSSELILLNDEDLIAKVKSDLDILLGPECRSARVVDAALVRLPNGVNWYFPGSYKDMPDTKSSSVRNLYFAGDIVRSRHGSWSQEKAFVTGIEAVNVIMRRPLNEGTLPLSADESHVAFGKSVISGARTFLGGGDRSKGPSLVDFFW